MPRKPWVVVVGSVRMAAILNLGLQGVDELG
jgi:hypothetical protein